MNIAGSAGAAYWSPVARFSRQWHRGVGPTLLRFSSTKAGEWTAARVATLDRLLHNDSGNLRLNGEAWLLDRLGEIRPSVVLDVGANRGDWTQEALVRLPSTVVHAFEPVPDTFELLRQRFGAHPRVALNQLALTSDDGGSLRIWTDSGDGTMSSATAPPGHAGAELLLPSTSGDAYVRSNGIDHIDLLKVDVEGHELSVFEGFRSTLERGAVEVVQFEFTLWAAIARQWLADYYEVLEPLGYQIGKLLPRRIAWKSHSPEDEQFLRANFVAARPATAAARALGLS